jgi:tetratricopeptide (TPR) repeat protein
VKIAVYTIALNEEKHVQRWYDSVTEADYLLIADTGSTDRTVELAESLGIHVVKIEVKPWRFDMARNIAMSNLPNDIDYCISLDMDEVLMPGWREEMEKVVATRIHYTYRWSEEMTFTGDKIHARHGYMWKHPVHECLYPFGIEETHQTIPLRMHHYPDHAKSRGQYLPLLKMSVEEDPDNDRNAHYYARELMYYGQYEESAKEFRRHLALPSAQWNAERAASHRYLAVCEPERTVEHLMDAIRECPNVREPWIELARYHYGREEWQECYDAAKSALAITEREWAYLIMHWAWDWTPWDLAAIAAYHIEKFDEAFEFGLQALRLAPDDDRLANNLRWYAGVI